jgi:glycosyltransferase involved in cell wall biosynthesis
VRALLWDVHGGYTDAFLHGRHQCLYLRDPDADELGTLAGVGLRRLGAKRPANAIEVNAEELRDHPPDVVIAQRLEEVEAFERVLRRPPGREVGAIFLEHNTPKGAVPNTRHPLADRPEWQVVHVTPFNRLMWDTGTTEVCVIEHGLPDPGHRWTGDLAHAAFVVNEPVRRWRTTGTDLLPEFAGLAVDAYGIDADRLPAALGDRCPQLRVGGNLSPAELDDELSQRRLYLHLTRWTSLGLSLINAMMLGMPVVALGTTEAYRAVPPGAGACSTDVAELVRAATCLIQDGDRARAAGAAGRRHALERFGLDRFLAEWTACLERVAG